MRQTLLIGALFLLLATSYSCKNTRMYKQLDELMGATITLPDRILCVYEGESYPMPDSLRWKTRFIVFVDSTECSKCRITRFAKYVDMFRLSDETRAFVPILLVSTSQHEQQEIIEHLQQIELPFPVYLDENHSFANDNPLVMADSRFSAVTVDEDGRVLLVGDPAGNEKYMAMFRREIIDTRFI